MNTIRVDKVCSYNYHDLSINWDTFGKSFFTIFEVLFARADQYFTHVFIIVDAYNKTTEICNSLFHFCRNDTLNINNCVLKVFKVEITMKYLCFP